MIKMNKWFPIITLAILLALAAFSARTVGMTFLGVLCAFIATMAIAFWFDFGRCPRCGRRMHPARDLPRRIRCTCGAWPEGYRCECMFD